MESCGYYVITGSTWLVNWLLASVSWQGELWENWHLVKTNDLCLHFFPELEIEAYSFNWEGRGCPDAEIAPGALCDGKRSFLGLDRSSRGFFLVLHISPVGPPYRRILSWMRRLPGVSPTPSQECVGTSVCKCSTDQPFQVYPQDRLDCKPNKSITRPEEWLWQLNGPVDGDTGCRRPMHLLREWGSIELLP